MTESAPIITLTTDFGLSDHYVAAMKGVLLSRATSARIVDISHEVRPQAITQAVFVTQCAWPFFPAGTVHIAVVDPGVGTDRHAIAMETPSGWCVGPDNGILSSALPDEARPERAGTAPLPPGLQAFAIMNPAHMLQPVSATFHARDIFAPAAAFLAKGGAARELGEGLSGVVMLPPLRALPDGDSGMCGQVLHIDRFGNLITDIREADLPGLPFVLQIGEREVRGPVATYAAAQGLATIPGSSGYLEVAMTDGSAAVVLGAEVGTQVRLRP